MSADPHDPRRTATQDEDDLSIVPGLGPVPPPRAEAAPSRLDPALDPDRYDPARAGAPDEAAAPVGPLDPTFDPDRYDPARDAPPGQGQTLPELLGEGAFEEKRDNYQWAIGLLGVLAFLALVSWFFSSVATP